MPTITEILDRNTVEYYDCVKMNWGVGSFTNAPWDITIDGNVYSAIGPMMGITPISTSAVFDIDELDVTLSGIVPHDGVGGTGEIVVRYMQGLDYIDQEVLVTRVYVKDGVIEQTEVIYKGYVTQVSLMIAESGSSAAANIKTSSHWINFQRVNSRYTNIKNQQAFFPTDNGFKFAKRVQKEIIWALPS